MSTFRFIHAADLHLDSPFRGLSDVPKPIRDRIRSSTFMALDRLVELAIAEEVHFIVIAGDVYDLEDRSVRAQLRFQRAMEQLAAEGIAVYIAHGNHDPLSGKHMQWHPPEGVYVFPGDDVVTHAVHDRSGRLLAHVHGISFATPSVTENLALRFRAADRNVFQIGVLHTNVDGASDHGNYAPASRAELIAAGFDYWALGHIHVRSILHEAPYIVYPGNTQGRNIKETGAKGCYIVDVEEDKTVRMNFRATDAVRWLQMEISIENARSEQELQELITRELDALRESAETDGLPVVARLVLSGRSSLSRMLMSTSFLDEVAGEWNREESLYAESDADYSFVWVESIKPQTRNLIDRELLSGQDSFVGDLLRIAAELRRDEAQLAQYAEQVMDELVRSRAGKYIREGRAVYTGAAEEAVYAAASHDELREWLDRAEDWLLDRLLEGGGQR
jgi:DNA repair exonuclease SbcCD nuclease subunit